MKNTRMMYLRQGNMFKEFFVERRNQPISSSGRPTNSFMPTMESLKGCLAEADPKEVMNWQQLQTPVTHTIVQEGSPKAKKNERLRLDNRTFDIKAVDDCGGLGISTIYYVEERRDVNGY